MAFQKRYGWRPFKEYPAHAPAAEPALVSNPADHNQNQKHVSFRTNNEEEPKAETRAGVAETETETETAVEGHGQGVRLRNHKGFWSVDQDADAFIKQEHKRIELAKLMSMRGAAVN